MKRYFSVVALVVLVAVLAACGGKKKSDDIIAPRVVKAAPTEPVRMQQYDDGRDVQWIGKTYHVLVHRQPCDTLPMVKDETGQKYVDNIFTLTVTRSDGSEFFRRQFTKKSFADYITSEYRKTGILEGIVFDRADGDDLMFAASVGHPQTDEYIPLVIRLTRMGVLSIAQDTQMDTAGSEDGQLVPADDDDGV